MQNEIVQLHLYVYVHNTNIQRYWVSKMSLKINILLNKDTLSVTKTIVFKKKNAALLNFIHQRILMKKSITVSIKILSIIFSTLIITE